MEKPISPAMTSPRQRNAAKSLDKAFHTQLTKTSLGMSPISMALARLHDRSGAPVAPPAIDPASVVDAPGDYVMVCYAD